MALGTPVLTTAIGVAGIEGAQAGVHLAVSETDDEFVRAALSLLADPEELHKLARNARNLIEQQYHWERIFENFDRIITTVLPDFFLNRSPVTEVSTHGSD